MSVPLVDDKGELRAGIFHRLHGLRKLAEHQARDMHEVGAVGSMGRVIITQAGCLMYACSGMGVVLRHSSRHFAIRACLSGGMLACLFLASSSALADDAVVAAEDAYGKDLRLRNGLIIATEATMVATYGMRKWWHSDFGGGFDTTNEGWFGANTQFGGADKLGHMYSNYANLRLMIPLFESIGNDRKTAISLATWATLGIFTGIEIADGYSRGWKFSPQDELANVAGVVLGVVFEMYPEIDRVIDFRVDYRRSPRSSRFDPFSDYSELKFLFVVKADGFEPLRGYAALRYLEMEVGYGARGYETGGPRSRAIYFGISLNLARLLADGAYQGRMHATPFQRGAERAFDLVQFPSVVYAVRELR